ncbi:MAG: STAS domain-containing protein [Phreatobacter sp.]|uniref:STAS domain-containing protein n=1 Tax=Phreatobacter sp. TaxID=1966341 RepID=UPI002732E185|nr:STAS domain-containing protein [Phreatobacter sp.]MDP2801256.1 STAS domain-containing protein [Phreatobacter sp.]
MTLTINEENRDTVLVVSVSGRLDGVTSKTLDTHIGARIAGGSDRIVLNLSGVDYISSFGLRLVLVAAKKLNGPGRRFVVCGLKDNVRQVFSVSGFLSILTLTDTVDEAASAASS